MSIIYTPLHIQMLFHYYGSFTDFRDLEAEAIAETIKSFLDNGIIELYEAAVINNNIPINEIKDKPKYVITEKGHCYARHILSAVRQVSLPVYTCEIGPPKFVIPKNINDLFDENNQLDMGPAQMIVGHGQFETACPDCGEMAMKRSMEDTVFYEHRTDEADKACRIKREGKK